MICLGTVIVAGALNFDHHEPSTEAQHWSRPRRNRSSLENEVKASGNASVGIRQSTTSQHAFVKPLSKNAATRSCITLVDLAKTVLQNASLRLGVWTVTTLTQISVPPAVARAINSGWEWIGPARIMQMQK